MSNSSHNSSTNGLMSECDSASLTLLLLLDVVTFVVGQPVVAALLWLGLTSRKTRDILGCNLALFNNSQYLLSLTHLCFYRLRPQEHLKLANFLVIYAQIGGLLSLFCICMQRYVAVIHPTWYRLLVRYRYREVCAAAVWVFAILTPSLYLYLTVLPSKASEILGNIPFAMMLYMVWMMVNASYKTRKRLNQAGPEGGGPNPAKRKAVGAIRATSTIMLALYLPSLILSRVFDDCVSTSLSLLLLAVASVSQPLHHLAANAQLLPCCRGWGHAPVT